MTEESAQDALARQRSIDAYTAAIAELEVGGGAYNAALAEELNALGLLFQQQEEHDEAVRLFDRSVHISRINSGLHSIGQVQAIENKLASLLAAQRWAEADATFDYLFYVQKRAYGDNDPRLLPTLDSIAQWNLRAFSMGHGEPLALRLSNAMQYYSAAARVLQINFGTKDERLVSYMRGIANSSYLMARNPDLQAALNDPQTRNTQTLLRDRLAQPRAIGIQGFTSGAQALIQILQHEIERRDDALAIAEAFANLADWYLLFGRGDEAEEQYMNAWRLLANQDNGDALLEAAFGRIVRMPKFATDAQIDTQWLDSGNEAQAQALRFDYADVMFDVSSGGRVRNVRVITQETEENEIQLRKLRRLVRDSTFRPIIKGGVPQRSEDNVLRYRYWY
jgi:tetratricopeptide (TPR) repeat protein